MAEDSKSKPRMEQPKAAETAPSSAPYDEQRMARAASDLSVELQRASAAGGAAPKAGAEAAKSFTVLRPFMHDGKVYGPGDHVKLSAEVGDLHVQGGAVAPGMGDAAAAALKEADRARLEALKASGAL